MVKTGNNEVEKDMKHQLFSSASNLLKYREEVVTDANHHSNELISAVKYYTTLISALFSLHISILLASFKLLCDDFCSDNPWLNIIIISVIVFIPIFIIILCDVALDNSKRIYRNTMEYVSIKMKIDELLGIHDREFHCDLRKKFNFKIFGGDTTFANSRWEEERNKWYSTSSGKFVNDLIETDKAGFIHFSHIFKYFKNIGYGFFIISCIIIFIIVSPLICRLIC